MEQILEQTCAACSTCAGVACRCGVMSFIWLFARRPEWRQFWVDMRAGFWLDARMEMKAHARIWPVPSESCCGLPSFHPLGDGPCCFEIMETIKIDPELKALIPPLSPEEYAQLEANILAEGCRDPLVVWGGILVDGHNRFEICQRHGIEFSTAEMEFPDKEAVMLWMEENQVGRRNLSDDQRSVFADSIRERRSRAAASKAGKVAGIKSGESRRGELNDSDKASEPFKTPAPKTDTRKEVAKEFNLPERKLRAVAEVKKFAPEMIAKVRAGQTTLLQAKREIKEAKREHRREENRKKVAQVQSPEKVVEQAKFATIVIDPPWDWGDEGDINQLGRAKPDYSTMSMDQLLDLPVGNMADDDCHLYLWITNRSLPKGFALIERWGFRYITALTWVKPTFGMGNYFRGQTEHVLFAVKGSQPLKRKDIGTVFNAPRGKGHSAKPQEFYELVESASPGPFIELFSRSERPGWVMWGESNGN